MNLKGKKPRLGGVYAQFFINFKTTPFIWIQNSKKPPVGEAYGHFFKDLSFKFFGICFITKNLQNDKLGGSLTDATRAAPH